MAIPTSAAIIAASKDQDLRDRAVALASTMDPPLSAADVESLRMRLATAPVDESGNTIASVFEYAEANYEPAPRPGEDPAAVTDNHILYALAQIRPTQQSS